MFRKHSHRKKSVCNIAQNPEHLICFWWSYDFIGSNTPALWKNRETNCDHVGADAMHPTFVEWWCGLGILGTLGVINGYMSNPKKLGYRVSHFRMIVRYDLWQKLAKMMVSLFGEPLPMEICCVLEKNNNFSVARLQYFAPPRPLVVATSNYGGQEGSLETGEFLGSCQISRTVRSPWMERIWDNHPTARKWSII